MARRLERKYGNAYGGTDNRSIKNVTAADKGSGYDENNGFIDDSEAVSDENMVFSSDYLLICQFIKNNRIQSIFHLFI